MDVRSSWEEVYKTNRSNEVSWYQEHAKLSLQFIEHAEIGTHGSIIDVGGGDSTMVDDLLDKGFEDVSVLDISSAAIATASSRLASRASRVKWIVADILTAVLPPDRYDLWHDRAVFHFLTNARDRSKYVAAVRRSVKRGGHVIVATFGLGGPNRCSGLDVRSYDSLSLHGVFGSEFELLENAEEVHVTPWGSEQQFVYCY